MSEIRVIGVGGAPGSGKSTLAAALARRLDLEVVRLDDFMLDRADMPLSVTGAPNQEVPQSLDLAWWRSVAIELAGDRLSTGLSVRLPVYSRREGRRTGERVLKVHGASDQPRGVIIEGHLLYLACVTPRLLLERMDLRIMVTCSAREQLRRLRQRQPGLDQRYYDQVIRTESYCRQGSQRRWADVVFDSGAVAADKLAERVALAAQSFQRGDRIELHQ